MSEGRSLDERIRTLENRSRLLVATVAGVLVVLFLSGAGNRSAALSARSFQLVDGDGRVRAELAMGEKGPFLALRDEADLDRLLLTQGDDATALFIADESGTTRIGVSQFAHGGGGFALHGPESKGAAVLYLKGDGSLRFFDDDGTVTNEVLSRLVSE